MTTYYTMVRQATDNYVSSITDRGTRAGSDLSLWIPGGPGGWSWFGMVGVAGYPTSPGVPTWIYQDQTNTEGDGSNVPDFLPPEGYNLAWGCTNQRSSQLGIFTPDAPLGYVGLGVVATSNYLVIPPADAFAGLACPHASLCAQVRLSVANGDRIWTDQGSNAGGDVSLWRLPTAQIVTAVIGNNGYYPDNVLVWDLDPSQVNGGS